MELLNSVSTLGLKPPGAVAPDIQQKVVEKAKASKAAQEAADQLKYQASLCSSDEERQHLLEESRKKEKEAHANSQAARRLASGAWQGTVGGAGVGSSVGAGLGTAVGTLVGTIAAIPMAGLGALIGLPIGLIHGPFFKVASEKEEGDQPPSEEEQHTAVIRAVDLLEDEEEEEKRVKEKEREEEKEKK